MKILAIGDPHAKKSNSADIRLLRQKIVELCKAESPDKVVILGDLGNDFAKMHLAAWQEIIDFIDEISNNTKELYYIVGNHDAVNNQIFLEKDHFFRVFDGWNNGVVKVVDRVVIDGCLWFVPYVPPGRFEEALSTAEVPYESAKIIFCHQEFRDAKMGAIKSVHGDKWPMSGPLIISGHIHDRDRLQQNILYAGAPYQTGFGDSSKKSVEIIEISEDLTKIKTRSVDLGMPKKITLRVTLEEFQNIEIDEENRFRVFVSGTSEEIHRLKSTKKYKEIRKLAKVIPKPTDKIIVKKVFGSKSFEEILEDSIKEESEHVKTEYNEAMKNASENQ